MNEILLGLLLWYVTEKYSKKKETFIFLAVIIIVGLVFFYGFFSIVMSNSAKNWILSSN